MRLSSVNIAQLQRVTLTQGKYKLSRDKQPPAQAPSVAHPEETKDFYTALNEMFNLELIGIDNKIFNEDERIYFDERAGIYEYLGGLSRAQAEERAVSEIFNGKFTTI